MEAEHWIKIHFLTENLKKHALRGSYEHNLSTFIQFSVKRKHTFSY